MMMCLVAGLVLVIMRFETAINCIQRYHMRLEVNLMSSSSETCQAYPIYSESGLPITINMKSYSPP